MNNPSAAPENGKQRECCAEILPMTGCSISGKDYREPDANLASADSITISYPGLDGIQKIELNGVVFVRQPVPSAGERELLGCLKGCREMMQIAGFTNHTDLNEHYKQRWEDIENRADLAIARAEGEKKRHAV
jgi:hypothetical protein